MVFDFGVSVGFLVCTCVLLKKLGKKGERERERGKRRVEIEIMLFRRNRTRAVTSENES